MARNNRNTYGRGGSSRKRKIQIRRWTLAVLILLIIISLIVVAAKFLFAGNDDEEQSSATSAPTAGVTADSDVSPHPSMITEPDKAVPVTASPVAETPSPEGTANPEESPSSDPQADPVSAPANELASTNLLDSVKNADGVKTAYLTFDDGPTKSVTPRILDTLRKYNIKATFFEIGSGIESNPDMARRVYDEGHLIANHSYAHNYGELYASEESFSAEVLKTESLIKSVTGQETIFKLFRFPGGGFKSSKDRWSDNKQKYKDWLKDNGYVYCDWNSLNGDAEGGAKTKDQLIEGVKSSIGSQEDVVILMHDAAAKSTTADALPEICEYLISQGFEFRRLDEFNK